MLTPFAAPRLLRWLLWGSDPRPRDGVPSGAAWVVGSLGLLAVTALGEVSPLCSHLSLFAISIAFFVLAPIAILAIGTHLWRRAHGAAIRMALALPVLVLTTFQGARVVYGVPFWVRWDSAPAISLVLDAYGGGPFPRSSTFPAHDSSEEKIPPWLDAEISRHGCFYSRHDDRMTFHLTCPGTFFTHCTYDHKTARWSAWD